MSLQDEDSEDDSIPTLVELNPESSKIVPVTILVGFLGSGKTTLLNYILGSHHGKRIAVIENEFSAGLGIEGMIAKSGVDGSNLAQFFELNNGCICCSVKGDLLATLEQLAVHKSKFDYILIETTGVANPGPIITALWTDDDLGSSLRLDGVVAMIDSLNLESCLNSPDIANDVKLQIAYADRILLNKIDLVTNEKVNNIEGIVQSINSLAEIQHTSYGKVTIDWILDINSYSTKEIKDMNLSNKLPLWSDLACQPCLPTSTSTTYPSTTVTNNLTIPNGNRPIVINNYSQILPPSILRSTKQQQQQQQHSANTLRTHGFTIPGKIDLQKLKIFLDHILYTSSASKPTTTHSTTEEILFLNNSNNNSNVASSCGKDISPINMNIYRMKGILNTNEDSTVLYIMQAVYDIFDIQASTYNKIDFSDVSKIIVIGRNIDEHYIETGILSCTI